MAITRIVNSPNTIDWSPPSPHSWTGAYPNLVFRWKTKVHVYGDISLDAHRLDTVWYSLRDSQWYPDLSEESSMVKCYISCYNVSIPLDYHLFGDKEHFQYDF